MWKIGQIGVIRGHLRTLQIAQFDSVHMSSYQHSIVTMSLS